MDLGCSLLDSRTSRIGRRSASMEPAGAKPMYEGTAKPPSGPAPMLGLMRSDLLREAGCRDILDALPAAIYATDPRGRVIYYNRAAAELAGREPRLGVDHWCVTWRLYHPDGRFLAHDECPMAVALKENR